MITMRFGYQIDIYDDSSDEEDDDGGSDGESWDSESDTDDGSSGSDGYSDEESSGSESYTDESDGDSQDEQYGYQQIALPATTGGIRAFPGFRDPGPSYQYDEIYAHAFFPGPAVIRLTGGTVIRLHGATVDEGNDMVHVNWRA